MAEIDKIHNFAKKWLGEFKNPTVSYEKLVSNNFGEECSELGFQVYCGHIFTEKYGKINDPKVFKEALKDITDINLLELQYIQNGITSILGHIVVLKFLKIKIVNGLFLL